MSLSVAVSVEVAFGVKSRPLGNLQANKLAQISFGYRPIRAFDRQFFFPDFLKFPLPRAEKKFTGHAPNKGRETFAVFETRVKQQPTPL
jgi:hypothetical protein